VRIRLVAVGNRMPDWVEAGVEEYRKRLTQDLTLDIVEIPAGKRVKNADIARLTEKEGEQMLASLHPSEHVICLDVKGKPMSTEGMSARLATLMQAGKPLALLVGGPEGLAPACLARADEKWSLSPLTLPHPLVRVLLAEQLYRCWTVIKGHPYHR
jgi:23S rRNA (pseudouridine1915-N3)-methyltransferase